MFNNLKVFTLMAGLTALFVVIGGTIGGQQGAILALLLAGAMNFFAYFSSGKSALRAFGARVVSREEAPELHDMVDRLRQRAGLPMPQVAIAPQPQPNAFASGRNPRNAVVCVTEGILQLVDRNELEGVLAHEIGHIKNGDILLQTVTATLAGAVGMMSRMGMAGAASGDSRVRVNPLMAILAPVAALLIQFAISRQREFGADRAGAAFCGRPLDLASALQKLDAAARRIPMPVAPSYAPMAQVDPLQAYGRGVLSLFSTHPPMAQRVARLQAIAGESLRRPTSA
jgi:heat shock protein HtpX